MVEYWQKASSDLAKIEAGSANAPVAGFVTGAYSGQPQFFDWRYLRHSLANGSISYYTWAEHFLGAVADASSGYNGAAFDIASLGTVAIANNALVLTTTAVADNFVTGALGLDFLVSDGPIIFDARFKIGTVVGTSVEVGLSDALTEAAGEAFSVHTVAGVTAVATDAIVVAYEDGGDANWVLDYVNTDAETGVDLGVAPADDTYIQIRIVVEATGDAQVWLNGTLISSPATAVATTALLTPWVTIKSAGAIESVSVDYLAVSGGSGL